MATVDFMVLLVFVVSSVLLVFPILVIVLVVFAVRIVLLLLHFFAIRVFWIPSFAGSLVFSALHGFPDSRMLPNSRDPSGSDRFLRSPRVAGCIGFVFNAFTVLRRLSWVLL